MLYEIDELVNLPIMSEVMDCPFFSSEEKAKVIKNLLVALQNTYTNVFDLKVRNVNALFGWTSTPQGQEYWSNCYDVMSDYENCGLSEDVENDF